MFFHRSFSTFFLHFRCHYFISIFKKVFTIGGMCRGEMKKHYTNVEYDFEFNGGDEFFKIEEMEVYKIRF